MRRDELNRRRIYQRDPDLHGSARWASRAHLQARGFGPGGRLLLGYGLPERMGGRAFPISTDTARHILTVAPTRSGKSVSTTVPALLTRPGSVLAIDPKGELAITTARFRRDVLGQSVFILDPWEIACRHLAMTPATLNPLDTIRPGSEDFVDDALLLADAMVMPAVKEPFWSDEGRALLMGLILYVSAAPEEKGKRHLGRVRALLSLPPDEFLLLLEAMTRSANPHVRRAGGRMMGKADREFSSVLSTAQQNTHFLEGVRLSSSLERSDWSFDQLGDGNTTIYLVLPVSRLATHARWLRLMLSTAIAAVAGLPERPDPPVYMLIEEMGALGKLDIVENAYGLMAGLGLQLHGIAQDLSQLQDLYDRRWQTFIANSGAIQFFGTRDPMTADFASRLCGVGTVESLTEDTAARRASLFGDPGWLSREDLLQQRPLITPDEVMTMHPAAQLLVLAATDPASAYKPAYFLEKRFRDARGRPVYDPHPAYAGGREPAAQDFTRAGLDIGQLLDRYITVG